MMSIKQKLIAGFTTIIFLFSAFAIYVIATQVSASGALTLILAMVGIFLAGGIGYYTVTSIVTPLTMLKDAAVAVGEGEFDITVNIDTDDEIGVLAEFMNSMVGDLSGAFGQLEWTLNHLRAIIDNLVDGLLVTDTQGKITLANPALMTMFGLEEKYFIGKSCQEVFGETVTNLINSTKTQPSGVFEIEVALAQEKIGKAVATAIVRKTYETGDASARGSGESFGSVVLIRDITVEKEVDRMKTDFISTVSHELRTPLTSVLGFAKISRKRLEEVIFPAVQSEEKKTLRAIRQVKNNINIIVAEGERLTALINDVLDIAKMEAGKIDWHIKPLAPTTVIDRAIAATSALFEERGLTLIQEIEPDLPDINGDHDRLIQVIINLISNAVKFTEEGSVTCRAERVNGMLKVSIIDTGLGITESDQPLVFERFKQVGDTLTDKPKGTGLGLPICKQIVEYHRGRIWVESELGQGSTFSFTLPVKDSTDKLVEAWDKSMDIGTLVKQLEAHGVTSLPSVREGQKTVLVVDDEPHIRELLRQELETKGYLVKEAKDGYEAIAIAKNEKPDLITLDVMMPEIDGFDVAAVLKNDPQTQNIPIIILSIVQDEARGYRLGVDRYVKKPFDSETLLTEIDLLLSEGPARNKVLVVDEDAEALQAMSKVLQAQGYNVIEASNNQELVEKAKSAKPDMIILNAMRLDQHQEIVKTLRFEKELENVLLFFFEEAEAAEPAAH